MKKNYWRVVSWILLWVVFFAKGVWMLDPDLGWHLRMGEVFIKSGFPLTDPFSYTMANFPMVANEWLINLLEYVVYRGWGIVGLAGFFATIAVIAIRVVAGGGKWRAITALLVGVVWLHRGGVRTQVVDWVFLGVEVIWLTDELIWKRWRWLMPVFLGVWANLHGGFAAGLVALAGVVGVKMAEKKLLDWRDLGVLVLGFAATGINPYGWGLWRELGTVLTSTPFFRATVAEWQPWYVSAELAFWLLFAATAMLMWRYRDKYKWTERGLFSGVFVMGISSLRHASLFAAVAGLMLARGWKYMADEFDGDAERKRRLGQFYKLMLGVVGLVMLVEGGLTVYRAREISEASFYPKKAVEWLGENAGPGEMLSDYGWGGYLIWKLPQKKVFVDGRMAGWHWTSPDRGQADWIFKDYLEMVEGKTDFEVIFEKYRVTTVLWPKLDKRRNEKFVFREEMERRGWLKVYEDNIAFVYKKL